MHHALELFLSIAKAYTDLTFGRSKDELISRCIKALRLLKDQSLESVKANREVSAGIEPFLERLEAFVKEHPEELDCLVELLGIFLKSPIPCKIRLINFSEVLVENRRDIKEGI
ncbi:hypothetical protein [Thermocrinis sp.]|uniref:hypothetical protein n=1 Tax=Thermocrinis sp. TaxID=2024383 RepID=UPI002FDDF8EE